VCVFPQEHYRWWREHLGLSAEHFPYGSFGENFTVEGQTEESAYIGDRYRIGTAVVELTKPRQPCSTLNKVWGEPQLAAQMGRRGLTGWYLRVLEPGEVQAGDLFQLLERSALAPTVADAWKSKQSRQVP
jgi:MOSC domain-containing protein YiiM